MTAELAVVALGNPYRRDDGVGPALVARLRDRDLRADCLDLGDAGFDLVHVVVDYEAIVIVDAVDFGGDPGEVVVFDPTDADGTRDRRASHGTDAFELLAMAERLRETSPTVRVVGIQPVETGLGEGLSPPVADRIPGAIDALERVLGGV
ncbi:hydrogenase maturation protease [Halorhabdus amylolytica]|uniref:hydrogenase maturation protease n=1 Tax=Halorhabdus amylolytica TaxID=2559573 RepID=UPI001B7D86EF|nr:hydrogenase maturation protease [Halorhabdus amylolytica]